MQRAGKFASVLFLLLTMVLLSGSAVADTVSMTFVGPGSNNSGGVYTYPYNFSIDGSSSTVSLICDAFNNEVVSGETWQATVNGLLSGNGMFGNQLLQYKAAGLIFDGILNGSIDANKGNWAIWGLFSSNATSNPFYISSGAGDLANDYLHYAFFAPKEAFNGLVLFTPMPGTQSWGGTPQEYIGRIQVPEPAEISMIALLGLMSLGAFVFRKRLGLNLAVARR
jgi:hypothetical protein